MTRPAIDNKPMTLAEITAGEQRHEGVYFACLGEADDAIAFFEPGTPDQPLGSGDLTDARLGRGLASYMGSLWGDLGVPHASYAEGWQERWALITPHRDDCQDDLEEDEDECCCQEEFSWWIKWAEPGTPGAHRVMWWSS